MSYECGECEFHVLQGHSEDCSRARCVCGKTKAEHDSGHGCGNFRLAPVVDDEM